jgi:60 kDa SS-A/Ro ribonucleoprotein
MTDALHHVGTRLASPQTERTLGRSDEVLNNAGGFVHQITAEQRLIRFLVLGVDGGTYYVSEHSLAKDNAEFLISAFGENPDLVATLVDVSVNGRAPRQNPTLFALAVASASFNMETRRRAYAAIPQICRTATMLFIFTGYVEQFRGWSRGLRTAIANWYLTPSVDQVAFQAVKYRQREGWTHRDLLRLSHPKTADENRKNLFNYITHGVPDDATLPLPEIIQGYLQAQSVNSDVGWVNLIKTFNLTWEMLPDAALNSPKVWEAMLPHMGLTAMIRNLGRFSKLDMTKMFSPLLAEMEAKLTPEALKQSRVHPFTLLNALMTYQSGHGFRGNMTWSVNPKIVEMLEGAFYISFGNVTPTNKRTLIAMDVSGSMQSPILNSAMSCREASAALAMLTVRTEPSYGVIGFTSTDYLGSTNITPLAFINKMASLNDVVFQISRLQFGGTDCSLPMIWAEKNKIDVETFIVLTDNETNAGKIKPPQALESYRQAAGHDAKLCVVGMTATEFSIADPQDRGMLDCVGFDSATPELISNFSRGTF